MAGRRYLSLLVFTSGTSVMAVEMTGLRLLAPYFGTSLIVTTVLIGTLMGFLSLGYRLGGRLGDQHPTITALSKVTGAAATAVLIIPFIAQPILRAASAALRPLISGEEVSEPLVAVASIAGGALGTLALLALPITLMGMVSPWAIRLAIEKVEESAQTAGRLYALSTFGSILGTFLPALVLVPLLGMRRTFIAIGATFLAVSTAGWLSGLRAAVPPAAALLLCLVPEGRIRPMPQLLHEEESIYHYIQVVVEPYNSRCTNANHLYLNEGVGVHSVKCNIPGADTRGYWAYLAATPLWLDEPQKLDQIAVVGLAGGTVARKLLDSFPDAHVDGVEIDGAVVEVGRRYFDNDDPRIRPIVMDGRSYMAATTRSYDLVLVDAYRQPYIPFHLVTREFFEVVKERLEEDGVLALNVASSHGTDMNLTAMIYRTLREVFPTVLVIDATNANDILIATTRPKATLLGVDRIESPDFAHLRALERVKLVLREKMLPEVPGWQDARVLTDDQAPVEMAWDLMALDLAG